MSEPCGTLANPGNGYPSFLTLQGRDPCLELCNSSDREPLRLTFDGRTQEMPPRSRICLWAPGGLEVLIEYEGSAKVEWSWRDDCPSGGHCC